MKYIEITISKYESKTGTMAIKMKAMEKTVIAIIIVLIMIKQSDANMVTMNMVIMIMVHNNTITK